MAHMIPENLSHIKDDEMTAGKKKLYKVFEELFPDDWICYVRQPIYFEERDNKIIPDFILISPSIGIFIIEESDFNYKSRELGTLNVRESLFHSMDNAEQYEKIIIAKCRNVKRLCDKNGDVYFRYGHCVILSNMTYQDMKEDIFNRDIDDTFVLYKNSIPKKKEDCENFIQRLQSLSFRHSPDLEKEGMTYSVSLSLGEKDINAFRGILYPEIIAHIDGNMYKDPNAEFFTLEVEQEQLVRGIGKNDQIPHRLVRGVTGSGKSLILKARAIDVARENPDWNILLTFFTRSLVGFFNNDIPRNVEVKTIGQTLYQFWKEYLPGDEEFDYEDLGYERINSEIKLGRIPEGKYNAIFVDEVQDLSIYQLNFLRLILNLSPDSNCALFAGDGIQNIYNRNITWRNHGFLFHGRSMRKDFSINYRNTEQIYEFAWSYREKFPTSYDYNKRRSDDLNYDYYSNIKFKYNGSKPIIKTYSSIDEEAASIADEIVRLINDEKKNPGDIAILHPNATPSNGGNPVPEEGNSTIIKTYLNMLKQKNIQYYWLSETDQSKSKYKYNINNVVISTPNSAKGLEWKIVFTPSLNTYIHENAANLTFVANTRAREILYPSEIKNQKLGIAF